MNCNDCGGFLPGGCECSPFGGRATLPQPAAARPIPPGECLAPNCSCEPGSCFQKTPATFTPAVRLEWRSAPLRTEWGAGMMVADLKVTKDTTATIYCEAQDTERVQAMFGPAASPAPSAPAEQTQRAGWRLVPEEPTEEMKRAGGHANSEWLNDNAPIGEAWYAMPMESVWRSMLSASPQRKEVPRG